jgi:peptidoglycan hydrolase-like protein with peptidoglycan-binding domain
MTYPTLPRLLFLLSLPAIILLPLNLRAQEAEPPVDAPAATSPPATAPEPAPVALTPEVVNAAMFDGNPLPEGQSPIVLKLQVLLDRAGFSPGVIDGVMGDNVRKAIVATEFVAGLPQDGLLDAEVWAVLQPFADTPVMVGYEISAEDLAVPFVPDLPSDYAALAKLQRSAWRTPSRGTPPCP